ncbi:MAG: hypothetical protein HOO06_05810 [Bdellovibrionaceae bacterium]|jgi:hypothetical protein|nr:hypothetical protein [Pseudobdellovibrionaceae bacterium]
MFKKSFFRRKYIVNPQLQFMLLTYMFFFAVSITVIMLVAHFLSYETTIAEIREFGFDENGVFFNFLDGQYDRLRNITLVALFISSAVLYTGGIVLSHRIAGPMVRFKSELNKLGETGEFRELKFREKDYFSEVAVAFNDAMKKMQERNDEKKRD